MPAMHVCITTLEPDVTAAVIDLPPSAVKPFSPDASPVGDTALAWRGDGDAAVMLGFALLVVVCALLAAVGATALWLVV